MTRRPQFPGIVPNLGGPALVKAVPKNVPHFDIEWEKKCAQTNTSYYSSQLGYSHRQAPPKQKMSYDVQMLSGSLTRHSSINNNNLEVTKELRQGRILAETSDRIKGYVLYELLHFV